MAFQQSGFPMRSTFNIRGGVRCSTVECYVRPAATRPNLHILHSATAHRILFHQKRAVGVQFEYNGKVVKVGVRREVVVSAGAIKSPHLLMVSGVGPRNHLHYHKVKVVADLPGVGQNLQDHVGLNGLSWTLSSKGIPSVINPFTPAVAAQYIHSRKGLLARPGADLYNAWVRAGDGDPRWPNVQLAFFSFTLAFDLGTVSPATFGFDSLKIKRYLGDILGSDGFSIRPVLLKPKSRGSVTLRSSDPRDDPVIDPNYLAHPDDVATLVDSIRLTLALGNTSAITRDLKARFFDKPLPECEREGVGSDRYWACYVRHMATTYLHYVGTCKMAPDTDLYGVVNHRLRVRGVGGVRVVDASVMPVVTAGNTNAPAIMIGEKGAHMIKEEWRS